MSNPSLEDRQLILMKVFARQKGIEFGRYLNDNGYKEYDESDRWISITKSKEVFTTAQLYDIMEDENK